jgi:uncharacterized protein
MLSFMRRRITPDRPSRQNSAEIPRFVEIMMNRRALMIALAGLPVACNAPATEGAAQPAGRTGSAAAPAQSAIEIAQVSAPHAFAAAAAATAIALTERPEVYDPAYVRIPFPGGDVPAGRGVCADVIVRAFRGAGLDLQLEVNRDMRAAFDQYPKTWGLRRPDPNIDHRRVLNLETFFTRKRAARPKSQVASDYMAGDVVSWRLDNGLPHIGIVSTRRAPSGNPFIVHNIGAGSRHEDVLFAWRMIGVYRWPAA